jgi:hypothetical protein
MMNELAGNTMATDNIFLMSAARESLKNKWSLAIGTFLIYILLTNMLGSTRSFLFIIVYLLNIRNNFMWF